jgi:AmiR/NasT family two-component response regulator
MKTLKILIAEAESQIRTDLDRMLASLGHEPLPAADGKEALTVLGSQTPDLAVLDIGMRFADCAEADRAINRLRTLPVLILASAGERIPSGNAAALPVQGFLVKPVEKRILAAAIESVMVRYEEAQAEARESAELRFDLESRRLVERAASKLIQDGKTAEEALQEIRRQARSRNVSLRLAAGEVLTKAARQ